MVNMARNQRHQASVTTTPSTTRVHGDRDRFRRHDRPQALDEPLQRPKVVDDNSTKMKQVGSDQRQKRQQQDYYAGGKFLSSPPTNALPKPPRDWLCKERPPHIWRQQEWELPQ